MTRADPVPRTAAADPLVEPPGRWTGTGFRPSWRELAVVLAGLFALGLLAFAGHVLHRGFYYDDWANVALYKYEADGILDAFQTSFDNAGYRPVSALYFPVPWLVFGMHMKLHLAWAVFLAAGCAALFYRLLGEVGMSRLQAGAAAALTVVFPFSDTNRFWPSGSPVFLNLGLFIVGLLLALRGLRAGDPRAQARWHAGALACYAASVFFSEGTVPLVVGASLLYWWQGTFRQAAARAAVDWPIAIAATLYISANSKIPKAESSQQLDHARDIADQLLTVLTRAFVPVDGQRRDVILVLLVGVVLLGALVAWRLPRGDRDRPRLWLLLVLAGGGVAAAGAAYAVYVPADAYYVPLQPGVGNRVNGISAFGYAIAVVAAAWIVATIAFRGTRNARAGVSAAALVGCAVIALVYVDRIRDDTAHWNRAFDLQEQVIAAVRTSVPDPAPGSTIFSFGHSAFEDPGIPVFAASWDLNGAVQVALDDTTLVGLPMLEGTQMVCEADRVYPTGYGFGPANAAPYGLAIFVDAATASGVVLDDQAECQAALPAFVPGPYDAP